MYYLTYHSVVARNLVYIAAKKENLARSNVSEKRRKILLAGSAKLREIAEEKEKNARVILGSSPDKKVQSGY